jgi:RNA polymerase sigma factor (TIGR02999 family)
MATFPTSIVKLLDAADENPASAPRLLAEAYAQLRALAQSYLRAERKDHTLQATALVHEAYLRLVGRSDAKWDTPAEFFMAAAETMRRVLIDHARSRSRLKRGGGWQRLDLAELPLAAPEDPDRFLCLDASIDRLAAVEPCIADIVRLRFFVGLGIDETARVLGISAPTVKRRWQWARAWLFHETSREGGADGTG